MDIRNSGSELINIVEVEDDETEATIVRSRKPSGLHFEVVLEIVEYHTNQSLK